MCISWCANYVSVYLVLIAPFCKCWSSAPNGPQQQIEFEKVLGLYQESVQVLS